MIIVREIFTAKPGMASKLAGVMKQAAEVLPNDNTRVLTDLVSDFNTVIFETELEDLKMFQQRMENYQQNTQLHEKMAGYTDLFLTGRREILQVK